MGKCWFLLLPVFLVVGCGSGDEPKLTEEELAKIPFAQREGLPEASGGFVLAVGGETVTADEIVLPLIEGFRPMARSTDFEQFKQRARGELERILLSKISN